MDAKLELFIASTMVKPSSGLAVGLLGETEVEKKLETRAELEFVSDDDEAAAAAESAALDVVPPPPPPRPPFMGVIVSSKELSLVRLMIQPSILRNSLSSETFCHETLSVVDETASTMTSSG